MHAYTSSVPHIYLAFSVMPGLCLNITDMPRHETHYTFVQFVVNMLHKPQLFSCSFPPSPVEIKNQVILPLNTQFKIDVIHLKSINTGTSHDPIHPSDYMTKTPSPPATHASFIHENPQSTVQTLIQLSCFCVSLFLIHSKTCTITYYTCLYMSLHSYCML